MAKDEDLDPYKEAGFSEEMAKKALKIAKEQTSEMEEQRNLGRDIVNKFKQLNGLTRQVTDLTKNQMGSMKTIRDFNNEILKDDLGRKLALEEQDRAIKEQENILLRAKLAQFSVEERAAQIRQEEADRQREIQEALAENIIRQQMFADDAKRVQQQREAHAKKLKLAEIAALEAEGVAAAKIAMQKEKINAASIIALEKEAVLSAQKALTDANLYELGAKKLILEAKMAAIRANVAALGTSPADEATRARLLQEQAGYAQEFLDAKKEEVITQRQLEQAGNDFARAQKNLTKEQEKIQKIENDYAKVYSKFAKEKAKDVELYQQEASLAAEMAKLDAQSEELKRKKADSEYRSNNALAIAVEEAKAAVEEAKKELAFRQKVRRELVASSGYLAYMKESNYEMLGPAAGVAKSFENFSNNIKTIPIQFMALTVLLKLGIERFVALDKAAEDFRKQTGFSNTQMVELRKNAEAVNVELQEFGVNIEEAYAAAGALTEIFGNTALVSKEAMSNVALMSANLGVSAKDSAEVLATFQGLGGASQETAMNVMKVGAGLSEKAGVPFKKVMEDIASASGETLAMLGANPSKLMKASIAARALGTDMNKLVSAQSRLLDYSSSINSELEASALLGKSVSFQKARQLAYEGDLAGAAKATLETVRRAGDFNKMNMYQRKALAAASGMELKDLTKMMAVEDQRRKIELSGTPEEREKLRIQTETLKALEKENDLSKQSLLDQNESAIRQQKMQGLMTKMKNLLESVAIAAADILEPLITPMVELIIPGLKIVAGLAKLILWPFKAFAGLVGELGKGIKKLGDYFGWTEPVSKAVQGISKWLGEMVTKTKDDALSLRNILAGIAGGIFTLMFFGKGGFGKLMNMVKAPFKFVLESGKKLIGKITGKGATAAADAAGNVTTVAKGTDKVPAGTGVKSFLSNLAEGLKNMGVGGVIKGAINLVIASPGLVTIIPGAVMAGIIPKKAGENIQSFLTGLASGLKEMGTGRVTGGSANLLLASVALVTMIPGAIAAAVLGLVGKPIESGLNYLSKGIGYMGNPNVFKGALGIALVGASIIPFAFAMTMFSKVDWGAVGIGALALVGFTAAAFGLGLLLAGPGAIIFGAGVLGITALGLALIPFSVAALAAGAGVKMLGDGIATAVDPILRLSQIDLTKAAVGIGAVGVALAAFGAGSAGAGLGSFVGNLLGGDPISKMEKLASMGDKLKLTAAAIGEIAQATSQFKAMDAFSDSINKLTTSLGKLNEQISEISLLKLAALTAMTATTAAATPTAATPAATTSVDMTGVEAKLDALTELLAGGAIRVYLDGKDISSGVANSFGR